MEIADSFYNSYTFTNTENNDIIKGGYQFKNSIKSSLKNKYILGGNTDEKELNRFDDLYIPIGLILNNYSSVFGVNEVKQIYNEECIDDNVFNKLINIMKHNKTNENIKTRKNKNKQNITKKNK